MPKNLLRARGSSAIPMTPFDETDAIDVSALRREIEFILEAGAASICVPVMVSEFDTLSEKERKLMVEVTCDVVAGRRPVIACATAGGRVRPVCGGLRCRRRHLHGAKRL